MEPVSSFLGAGGRGGRVNLNGFSELDNLEMGRKCLCRWVCMAMLADSAHQIDLGSVPLKEAYVGGLESPEIQIIVCCCCFSDGTNRN